MFYHFKGTDEVSHTYLICRFGRCLLIDPSHDYEAILDKIGDQMLDGVLITHAHSDHVHLLSSFAVPIYVHQADAALLFDDKNNGYHDIKRSYKRKELEIVLLTDEDTVYLSDQKIQVIHTPGHTKGSVSYLYQQYLFTGDTLFKNDVGRHDLYSGNLFELKRSILKLIDTVDSNTKIYPGHDDISTVRDERKKNPFYLKWKKQGKI